MASHNGLISKIGDYLQDRQKSTNFGTCKRCDKKVYWSTTKIASHIRSGHCSGTPEEEVQRFKREFVYDSPKNLVHKSALRGKVENLIKRKLVRTPDEKEIVIKKQKDDTDLIQEHYIEEENNEDSHIMYEVEGSDDIQDEKLEILYVQENYRQSQRDRDSETSEQAPISKDEKFIAAVYPQFKGKAKLQLIDEILDLKRQNELLQAKVKTYEKTIHSFL